MSYYHGSKMSESQQPFSQRRPFAVSNDGKIVWATVLFLSAIMHWKNIHVNIFRFLAKFAGPRFVETQTF